MPVIRDRLIKGDSRYTVDYITEAHEAYKYYINRWTFLGDSYNGGYDYFMGRYMEPYYYESREEYEKRLRMVPLDNHVKSVVGIYNSFLFRKQPQRMLSNLDSDPTVTNFMKDADLDGRSFESFIKEVSTSAMVYGNCWVIIDKPNTQVNTRAEELEQEIRPYVSMFTPDNVLDWKYERQPNGLYTLTYLKVREEIIEDEQYIREYTPEEINVYKLYGREKKGEYVETMPNTLGRIPAVCVYAQRSNIRGVGISTAGDIADQQKAIYEEFCEVQEIIRLTNHPSLVKTASVEAAAGAGSIIQMPENMDPQLRPYLLQPNGSSIDSVLASIDKKVEAIDRMACLAGIRMREARRLSGVGLQTEFQMLNARLADFAANLELAEEQIWRCYAMYQGTAFNGEIRYPRSFSIQDKANDITMLKMVKDADPQDPIIKTKVEKMMLETLTEKSYEEVKEWYEEWQKENAPSKDMIQHAPVTSADDLVSHLREMVEAGYTDDEIKTTHPELAQLFNNGQDQV
jgi:hypothetical protein